MLDINVKKERNSPLLACDKPIKKRKHSIIKCNNKYNKIKIGFKNSANKRIRINLINLKNESLSGSLIDADWKIFLIISASKATLSKIYCSISLILYKKELDNVKIKNILIKYDDRKNRIIKISCKSLVSLVFKQFKSFNITTCISKLTAITIATQKSDNPFNRSK